MWDQESELLYLRARYYEPETGRFLSRDSYEGNLQNPLSRHLYAYVGNNPVNYVDPSGNWASDKNKHDWEKSTHRWITGRGIDLVYNNSDADQWYKEAVYSTYRVSILNGSDDADDNPPYWNHFYDPEEKANYIGLGDTALSELVQQYNNAVKLFKQIRENYTRQVSRIDPQKRCLYPVRPLDYSTAFYTLGRAVHFIQDLNNPYHASNMIADIGIRERGIQKKWSDHAKYETWTNDTVQSDRIKYTETSMTFSGSTDINAFGRETALRTHIPDEDWQYDKEVAVDENLHPFTVKIYKLEPNETRLLGYIKASERDTAQILYSFYLDVK